jgi:peroxiredoxin
MMLIAVSGVFAAEQPGAIAPDFRLKRLHASDEISLSSFRGKRPVVLVFGSYT